MFGIIIAYSILQNYISSLTENYITFNKSSESWQPAGEMIEGRTNQAIEPIELAFNGNLMEKMSNIFLNSGPQRYVS